MPNVKITQLYIKWNEKIDISAKDIKITTASQKDSKIDVNEINRIFNKASLFSTWIERITVKHISLDDIKGSFNFDEEDGGFLQASSDTFSLKSNIYFKSEFLIMDIESFKETKSNSDVSGNIFIDDSLNITTKLSVNINDDLDLEINTFANRDKLLYKIYSKKNIKSIKHLVDSIGLHKEIRYWIIDAIDMSELTLSEAYGWIEYEKLSDAYKNIHAKASLKDLNYTYDKKLDAIHTLRTDLEFKDGFLFIYPRKAYSYNQFLGESWLKIDFTKKQELLTLQLLFDGIVNKDILTILNRYEIELPFLQKEGKVATDLELIVNLHNIKINTKGTFFVEKGKFEYLGLDLDIERSKILLNNYDVKVENMLAHYQDIATAKVDFNYNAKKSVGKIDFNVKKINYKEMNLSLKDKSLKVSYNINRDTDTVDVAKSKWKFSDYILEADKVSLLFSMKDLIIDIPKTKVRVENTALMNMYGKISLKEPSAHIDMDVSDFSYKGIKLSQETTNVKLAYQKDLNITIQNGTKFSFKKSNGLLDNTSFNLQKENIILKSSIHIDNLGKMNATLNYNTDTALGKAGLNGIDITNKKIGNIFHREKDLNLKISNIDENLKIYSKEFDSYFLLTNSMWTFNTNSIDAISEYSEALQKFKITNGKLNLNQSFSTNHINFTASTNYAHKILVINNRPTAKIIIYGKINTLTNEMSFTLNELVKILIDDKIHITAKDIGINIDELLNTLESDGKKKETDLNLSLQAKNCFLYITKDRHVISDEIDLQYSDNTLIAKLQYKDGSAGFNYFDNNFQLYGEKFNDQFMGRLLPLAKFKGGELSFSMNGTTEKYDGVFNIDNTTIKNYKLINNILALVNTIPSLVTFSLPGYSNYGLKVENSYLNFTSENHDLNISNVFLDSKELKILGKGNANIIENSIDMKLNLKTDLGSAVSKVPVVGHILFDGDSISTSLSIKGKLNDPTVKSLFAEEIIVAPLNIIKRTLLYPYHLLSQIDISSGEDMNISEEDE